MLLAIDVGNTNIVYGLFDGKKLTKTWRQETGKGIRYKGLGIGDVDGVMISSVVPSIDKPLERAIKKQLKLKPVFVSYKNIRLRLRLRQKAQAGADRLVNAYAVAKLYGAPAIIVDFGTATTFCAVNSKGEYLGGAIAPGIRLSMEALHYRTAKLPLIDFSPAKNVIGVNTKEAMLSGVFFGYISLVEGMVKKFKAKLGKKTKVVATGGFSTLIGKKTRVFDIIDPELTLKGLRMVWEALNVRRTK